MTWTSPPDATKMPRLVGLIAIVLLGLCKRTVAEVDVDYTAESKILGVGQHFVYQLFHDEKNFVEADEACLEEVKTDATKKPYGHLVTIADKATMTKIAEGLFEHDLFDEESERFFWMGLHWNNSNWQFTAGNPHDWAISKYSNWDDDPAPDENDKHCVGIRFTERGKFKWHVEECNKEAPYICQLPNAKCLPWVVVSPGQLDYMEASKSNYGCPNYQLSMRYIVNMCECQNPAQTITIDSDNRACDDTHMDYFWHDKVCVPGCHPNTVPVPEDAVLLDPLGRYYQGSRVDYYCPGYFEYKGDIHPHNIFQVPCFSSERFAQTLSQVKCHDEDPDDVNDDIQQLDAVVGHTYHLKCEYKGYPDFKPVDYLWYRNGERVFAHRSEEGATITLLDGDKLGMLKIEGLTEDRCGIYMCLVTYGVDSTSFVPGNVYNISVDQYLKAQANLRNRNEVIERFAGYYMNSDGTYSTLQAYLHKTYWGDAHEECANEKIDGRSAGGHIAMVNGSVSFPLLRNFFSAQTLVGDDDESVYPDFYWVGDLVDRISGKLLDSNGQPSGPVLPVDARGMRVISGDNQAVGVKLNSMGQMELVRSNVLRKAPFICSFQAHQCLPPGVIEGSAAQQRNYACSSSDNGTLGEVAVDNCKCTPSGSSDLRLQMDGHKSCNHEATWPTTLCLPWCIPKPVHEKLGKLVTSAYRQAYYRGMLMTYFCDGHYEVDGAIYPQNSIQVACDPGNGDDDDDDDEEDVDIECKPQSSAAEDEALDTTYFDSEDTKEILLPCKYQIGNPHAPPPRGYVWMHNEDALEPRSPNQNYYPHYEIKADAGGSLVIQQPDKSSAGVYMCFADYDGLLVAGSVHKLRAKETDEPETESTIDESSGASHMTFHFQILAFYSALLCHALPLILLGVLLC